MVKSPQKKTAASSTGMRVAIDDLEAGAWGCTIMACCDRTGLASDDSWIRAGSARMEAEQEGSGEYPGRVPPALTGAEEGTLRALAEKAPRTAEEIARRELQR